MPECEICATTKIRKDRSRRPRDLAWPRRPWAVTAFDLFHFDEGFNGSRYLALFTYAFTNERRGYDLVRKTEVATIVTDGESSLFTPAFLEDLEFEGITVSFSSPGHPHQNGLAERSGGVVTHMMQRLMAQSGFEDQLWPLAMKTAIYILNGLPTARAVDPFYDQPTTNQAISPQADQADQADQGQFDQKEHKKALQPIERRNRWLKNNDPAWSGLSEDRVHRDLRHVRAFGCKAYPLTRQALRGTNSKLSPKGHIGYLAGIISTTQYVIWVPSLRYSALINTAYIIFNEKVFYKDDQVKEEEVPEKEASDWLNAIQDAENAEENDLDELLGPNHGIDDGQATDQKSGVKAIANLEGDHEGPFEEDPPRLEESAYEDLNNAPLTPLSYASEEPERHISFNVSSWAIQRPHRDSALPPPRAYRDLYNREDRQSWMRAMRVKLDRLDKKGTAKIVTSEAIPKGTRPIDLMWVYAYKFDQDGFITDHKARIVVRGDLQPPSQLTVSAYTLASRTFRLLMAIAAHFDLEATQYDFVNAFCNADLDEEVYCKLPNGFTRPGKYWRLRKALYGLRRSPLLWYRVLVAHFKEKGYRLVQEDPCVMTNGKILIFFYVDDLVALFRKAHSHLHEALRADLLRTFRIKELGQLRWFLGIEVIRDRASRRIWLSQQSYVLKVVTRFEGLLAARKRKAPKQPLGLEALDPRETTASKDEVKTYQRLIGSILYAAIITRPDTAFAAAKLSQFLSNPAPQHQDRAVDLLAFLRETKELCLAYGGPDESITAMSDASFADNVNRKSSQGFIIKVFGGAVAFKAGKQNTVTTSTTEAEFLSLAHTAREIYSFIRLCHEIEFKPSDELTINCDNRQTVRLVTEEGLKLSTKLRHVDIHSHWLRQEVQNQRLKIVWIDTNQMIADGLTKPLQGTKFELFQQQIGLTTRPSSSRPHDHQTNRATPEFTFINTII
ncbi:hypothetical protein XA68_16605 [Ophiocordyceps unilateralis]|uniref:Integrase catalytic domain-containing protein n=1 Tax=Ophiocordyceps unilateralis TaxID=268505 RepID=A0A2A9P685_OPHUN|nr:hypothetical protein XA68_16605 [Ophiocordyceps unilateralis]